MEVRDTIWVSRCTIGLIVVTLIVIWVAIVATSRLWYIGHNLHTTRNNTSRTTATGGVRGRCGPSKAFCQLFDKGLSYVVGSYMNRIGNTEDYERSFR